MNREELINKLEEKDIHYNFDNYSTAQLIRLCDKYCAEINEDTSVGNNEIPEISSYASILSTLDEIEAELGESLNEETEDNWDSARVVDLVYYYFDKYNYNDYTLDELTERIKKQMKREGSILPTDDNIFTKSVQRAVDEYNEGAYTENLVENLIDEYAIITGDELIERCNGNVSDKELDQLLSTMYRAKRLLKISRIEDLAIIVGEGEIDVINYEGNRLETSGKLDLYSLDNVRIVREKRPTNIYLYFANATDAEDYLHALDEVNNQSQEITENMEDNKQDIYSKLQQILTCDCDIITKIDSIYNEVDGSYNVLRLGKNTVKVTGHIGDHTLTNYIYTEKDLSKLVDDLMRGTDGV